MATEQSHETHVGEEDTGPQLSGDGQSLTTEDLVGLFRDLEASGRFVRDTGLGRIFHPGKNRVSYREAVRENSLHILIDGNRVSAHIDSVSPLAFDAEGTPHYSLIRAVRYSFGRVVVHNLAGLADSAWRLVRGRWNDHRCEFQCEVVIDDDEGSPMDALDAASISSADGPSPAIVGFSSAPDSASESGVEPRSPEPEASSRRVPFSVVDEAIYLLDTDATPWSVQLEARVSGGVDPERLRTAVHQAVACHPMARARVAASSARSHHSWEIASAADVDPFEVFDCPDDTALDAARARLQSTPVPLELAPPFRVWLARNPGGDVVMLHLNHVATDGFGGLRLLHSIAGAYRGAPDPPPSHDPLDDRTLPARLAGAVPLSGLRRALALAERLRDLVTPPARLARRPARRDAGDVGYGFHQVRLDEEETQRIVAQKGPGTVNDVLVTALHRAIQRWNAGHGVTDRRVTVLVPANLRPPRWRDDVVGNFSLPARITTTPRQRRTPKDALDAVISQTSRKKRSGVGTALLQLLDWSQPLPLWAKRVGIAALDRTGGRFVDTALLSNLGNLEDPPSFGEAAGETGEMWFSAPGRMPLGLSVGALTVAGRLHLVFRYDERLFDAEAAQQFVDAYLDELRDLVEVRSWRRPGARW